MYKRGDIRLDLFVKKIFRTKLSPRMEEDKYAIHDFKNKNTLKVVVLKKEHIVQLKAITGRQNDFDDILSILEKEKRFDWNYLIEEVIWQHENGDSWAILDTEKMMKALKDYVFIEKKYFDMLYKAQK